MIIHTQDGCLVNTENVFSISAREFSNGYAVKANSPDGFGITLGEYPGRERAAEVLDEIFHCHQSRYTMPE